MKLVTFNDYNIKKEVLVNCDNISFVKPSVLIEGLTEIFFTNKIPVIVIENYEEVKKKLKECE